MCIVDNIFNKSMKYKHICCLATNIYTYIPKQELNASHRNDLLKDGTCNIIYFFNFFKRLCTSDNIMNNKTNYWHILKENHSSTTKANKICL